MFWIWVCTHTALHKPALCKKSTDLSLTAQTLAGGWLGKDISKKPEETQQLSFSFQAQAQDQGSAPAPQLPWQTHASSGQVADEATMLRQALLGLDRQGGLYLTPILYRPTVQVWGTNLHH